MLCLWLLASITQAESLPTLTAAQAESLLPPSVRQSLQSPVLRAPFDQSKTVAGLPKPLLSSGEVLLVRGQGMDWRLEKPFNLSYTLTARRLVERRGKRETVRDPQSQPGLAAATELMLALFALDFARLERDFLISGQSRQQRGADTAWQLVLKPRSAALQRVFQQATLAGEAQLDSLRLQDGACANVTPCGDTEIRFGVLRSSTLSPTEAAWFR